MHIITKRRLKEFWRDDPVAKHPLDDWYRKLEKLSCENLPQLRETFPHADLFGSCVVFNAGGNKYRIVTWVNYRSHQVFIRHVLTHREYDRNKWKTDCI